MVRVRNTLKASPQGTFFDFVKETMPREERMKYQERKLRQIVKYAYLHAPAMKDKFDRAGILPSMIRTISDLEIVPITRKKEIVELQKKNPPFGGLLTVGLEDLSRVFMSPGPVYEPLPWLEGAAKVIYNCGFRKGDRVIVPLSYHVSPGGAYLDEGFRSIGVAVIPTGVGNTDLQLEIMRYLKVTGYTGNVGFLQTLMERAKALKYDIKRDFCLRRALVAGDICPMSWRADLEREYGFETVEYYGNAEIGLMCYECKEKNGMHFPEDVIVEIVDPNTGKQLGPNETGEIVLTTLVNKEYPLIRYGTDDLSSYFDEPCTCGRTSPRLRRLLGRKGDVVRVRNMFVHSANVSEAISQFPEISKYQLVIDREGYRDSSVLRIELATKDVAVNNRDILIQKLQDAMVNKCKIKVDHFEFVTKGTISEGQKIIVDKRMLD